MKTRIAIADWSTINLSELRKLPVFDWEKHGYHLQTDAGNACAGDPPGYPTYFTRSVYNASDNNPRTGFSLVIEYEGKAYGIDPVRWAEKSWEEHKAKLDTLMRKLWRPLPLDHPRTQAWIRATFKHHHTCYQVPELKNKGWQDAMLIWPGGCLGNTPFGKLRDPVFEVEYAQKTRDFDRWTDAHKAAFLREIEQGNAHIKVACEVAAVPDNHDGTIIVRRYYPEFQPTAELINAEFGHPGNWWEVMAEQPKPHECPGQYGNPHPVNGSWCQMCGFEVEPVAA